LPPPLPAVTLVHIPVILAVLIEGPWVGVPVGLIFGLCSFIRAWETGMVGLTLFFRNPLVSILPRMIIPLTAWVIYRLWSRLFSAKRGVMDKIGAGVAAVAGALTNTVLCLGMILLLYGADLSVLVNNLIALGGVNHAYQGNAGMWLVVAVGLPNGLAEAAVAAIVVPMIKTAVDAIRNRGTKRKRPPAVLTANANSEANQGAQLEVDAQADQPIAETQATQPNQSLSE